MKKLMSLILESELKKIEHKISFLSEFDKLIFLDREELKDLQQQIFAERISLSLSKTEGKKFLRAA